jgi:hypothetical protein
MQLAKKITNFSPRVSAWLVLNLYYTSLLDPHHINNYLCFQSKYIESAFVLIKHFKKTIYLKKQLVAMNGDQGAL